MKKTLKMENQEGDFYAESFFVSFLSLIVVLASCSLWVLISSPVKVTCIECFFVTYIAIALRKYISKFSLGFIR